MCGDFRAILLAKSLPYTNERPVGLFTARPVRECTTQKSGQGHFFDTLRGASFTDVPRSLYTLA
ncbi:MAG: hypothetical protein IKB78_08640, partial [Clostridia bacterium]|nr:hypothetical protein [Clostridia bacterium]